MATNLVAGLDLSTDWYHWTGSVTTGRADPDGGSGAAKYVPDTSAANHNLGYDKTGLASAARKASFELTVKPAGYDWLWVYLTDGAAAYRGVGFDLGAGSVSSAAGSGAASVVSTSMLALGGGWHRCRLVVSLPASTTISVVIRSADNSGIDYMAGDGTSGVDIYDAALYDGQVAVVRPGAFALTGQAASLTYAPAPVVHALTAAAGGIAETGQAADLATGRLVGASAGARTLGGQAAGLLKGFRVAADAGAFALAGQAASLFCAPAGGYALTADASAATLSGQPAGLFRARLQDATAGAFSLGGQGAALRMSRALPAPEGGILLQGQAGTLTRIALADFMLAATPGALAIAGARVTLRGPVWTPAPSVTAPWTPVALNPGAWALVDNNPQTRMGP